MSRSRRIPVVTSGPALVDLTVRTVEPGQALGPSAIAEAIRDRRRVRVDRKRLTDTLWREARRKGGRVVRRAAGYAVRRPAAA